MITEVKELNVIICGVGGQGVVLISELLGHAAVYDGLKVRGSEVLGMAQRGGAVFSNIRIGSEVQAPLTPEGKCDILVALEPSEALRNINFVSESSLVILNTKKVVPYTVYLGESKYPSLEEILQKLNKVAKKIIALDAAQIAEEAGNLQSANIVMLGALFGTKQMPINLETVKTIIQGRFSSKFAAINIKSFDLGYNLSQKILVSD